MYARRRDNCGCRRIGGCVAHAEEIRIVGNDLYCEVCKAFATRYYAAVYRGVLVGIEPEREAAAASYAASTSRSCSGGTTTWTASANAYCTQLTTLTQAEVDVGIPLAKACRMLTDEYKFRERLFASFGDDAQQFERNCAAFGLAYPFGPTHLNVNNLAAVAYGWSRAWGMSDV